ncbi:MAG: zinc ribbon domain-containing protein [Mangrovibacterium sp.]
MPHHKNIRCQSCGLPLQKDPQFGGTNSNGSRSTEYCSYCYENGQFKFQGTAIEFQDFCRKSMINGGHGKIEAWLFTRGIPHLKRWKSSVK